MCSPAQFGSYAEGKWCWGRSMIVNPWGTVLATAPDEETVIHATIDKETLAKVRRQVPSLANRQPNAYRWPDVLTAVRD